MARTSPPPAAVAAAAAAAAIVLSGSSASASASSSSSASASALRTNPAFVPPPYLGGSLSRIPARLGMSTDVEPAITGSSSSGVDPTPERRPWWEGVVFDDADLASTVRPGFPILSTRIGAEGTPEGDKKPLIYLDSAATSQKPTYVTDSLTRYYHTSNSNVHRGAHCLSREATSLYEAARDSLSRFVNAESRNEIIFTSGATEAINLVASSYGRSTLRPGDEVVISELEHHSNVVPWQMAAEGTGSALRFVPVDHDTGKLDMNAFESILSERTKMVSLQHVSNVLGCVHPIDDIVSITRSKSPSAKILLDACQSVPHMPVDVRSLGVDFLAASGHKMCGPTGIGFLWGREDLLNSMPPYMGGGEMIDEVYVTHSTYAPTPARFEAGTPAIAQSVGLGAAVEYLEGVGMGRIEEYEREIGAYLYRRLDEVDGVTVLGPRPDPAVGGRDRVALVSFVCDGVHPSDLSTFLDMEGVAIRAGHHCCQPLHRALGHSHSARASLYFYNTKGEIDYFVEKLEETLDFFRGMEGGGGVGAYGESGAGGGHGGGGGGGGDDGGDGGGDGGGFVPFI